MRVFLDCARNRVRAFGDESPSLSMQFGSRAHTVWLSCARVLKSERSVPKRSENFERDRKERNDAPLEQQSTIGTTSEPRLSARRRRRNCIQDSAAAPPARLASSLSKRTCALLRRPRPVLQCVQETGVGHDEAPRADTGERVVERRAPRDEHRQHDARLSWL